MNNKTRFSNFFFKNCFKNKAVFKSFNSTSNLNNKFFINFSNKFYMSKVFFLKNTLSTGKIQVLANGSLISGDINLTNETDDLLNIKDSTMDICDMLLVRQGKIIVIKKENLWNTLVQLSIATRTIVDPSS